MAKRSGVYAITNRLDGRVYVGSSVLLSRRLKQHRSDLRAGTHANTRLQRAWKKYGESAFHFETIELVDEPGMLLTCEQSHIDRLRSADRQYGYNLRPNAASNLGRKATEEQRKRTAEVTRRAMTPEMRERIRRSLTGRKRDPAATAKALETGRKRREAGNWKKIPPPTAETIEKRRMGNIGKKRSPEARKRLAANCNRMSAAQRGVPQSAEHIAKRSAAMKAYHARKKAAECFS